MNIHTIGDRKDISTWEDTPTSSSMPYLDQVVHNFHRNPAYVDARAKDQLFQISAKLALGDLLGSDDTPHGIQHVEPIERLVVDHVTHDAVSQAGVDSLATLAINWGERNGSDPRTFLEPSDPVHRLALQSLDRQLAI